MNQGLRIPEDIAAIGCGNLHYDDSSRVPLSSIDQHSQRIGAEAAQLVLATFGSKTPPEPKTILLPTELFMRSTTARQPRKSDR